MAKVALLIQKVNKATKAMDADTRKRNFLTDKGMFAERLKMHHMFEVIQELEALSGQKVQVLRHNFSQAKTEWRDNSETEMLAKLDYEESRMSKFMSQLAAKERKKRNQAMT